SPLSSPLAPRLKAKMVPYAAHRRGATLRTQMGGRHTMQNLKVLLKTLGYGFGALFVLVGVTGAPSAVALGLGLLAFTLLVSNPWGLRAHVRYFNSPRA